MKKLYFSSLVFLAFTISVQAQTGMGIGTNNPAEKLEVVGAIKIGTTSTTNAGTIRWTGTDFEGRVGGSWVSLTGGGGADDQNLTGATLTGTSLQIDIESGNSTTVDLSALVNDADADASNELQTISLSGSTLTLSNGGGSVNIGGDADWTVSGNNQYSAVSGNVGIGTTTPDAKLELYNAAGTTMMKITKDGTQNSSLFFVNGNNGTQGTTLTLNSAEHFILQNNYADKDIFFNINDGGTATDVMFIDGGESRVGILNVAPDYELDVSGDVGIDGRLVHNGNDNTNIEFTTDRIQFFAGSNTSSWIDIQSAGSELTINENDLQRDFRIEGGTDEELFFVDGSADRIGISTNAPDATLDIEGTLQYVDGNQAAGKVLTSDGSGNATWQDAFGGTSLADDDNDTKIQVEESADEDKIRFDTGNSERMIIDENGNIGVGTSSPVNLLHVQNNVSGLNFPLFLRNSSISAGDGAGIGFLSEPNGNWTKAGIYYERTAGFGVGKLHLLVDDGADNQSVTLSESRLTVKSDGNVGIGTTNPQATLDVNGNTTTNGLQVGTGTMFSGMQGGKVDVGASGGGEIVTVNVTFSSAFGGTPNVICTASAQPGTNFDDSFNVTTRNVSATGFTMIVNRVDGSTWGQDVDVHWFAFQ